MPSIVSPSLRLELQETGENLNAWGKKLNDLFSAVEQAIASVFTLTVTGDRTLTADNYVANEYRRGAHYLTTGGGLAAAFTITVPPVSFIYTVTNLTTFPATYKTASGVGAVIRPGMTSRVLCDGTDCRVVDPTLDQIKTAAAPVSLGGQRLTNVGTSGADTDAINRGEVAGLTAAGVQLANDWAQKTSGSVDGGSGYSARLWATSTTILTGGLKGALGYANDASASATSASTSAGNASTSATNAANSATQAAQQAANLSGTSTTSQTLGAGSKIFTTQAGKFFGVGTRLLITSDANAANYFFGTATAYSGTSLTVNVTTFGGTGSASDWTIRVSGERGAIGPNGVSVEPVVSKTAAYTLAAADLGYLINCSGGPWTLAGSASTVGAGWWADIKNTLPGVLTFTPSSGTVDGLASIQIYGESFRLLSDGTNFYTANRTRRVLVGLTTIATATAAVAFSGLADPEIGDYELGYVGVVGSAQSTTNLTFSQSGTFVSANYTYAHLGANNGGSATTNQANGVGAIILEGGNAVSAGATRGGLIRSSGWRLGAPGWSIFGNLYCTTTAGTSQAITSYGWNTGASTSPIDGIRIAPSTGNFTAGVVKLYGLRG